MLKYKQDDEISLQLSALSQWFVLDCCKDKQVWIALEVVVHTEHHPGGNLLEWWQNLIHRIASFCFHIHHIQHHPMKKAISLS